ncbi:ABC transporter substrate-binding protein [Actinomadura mexicana]|uniref:ABC-type branched-chain amino acid transport system, substrate-binding protein n=1 Tax=Actinomadura mexicana TaxID=134959 RepID=A0A238XG21_9ACTN|nr:ABC transporter substrate-binding protein [Actinomadura mexicana]SNR57660.1 ABC-type branched-chain amino acid transport system, substrate-binding protein [Actinomadura mexicana]
MAISTASRSPHENPEEYRRRVDGANDLQRMIQKMRRRPTHREGDVPLPTLEVSGPQTATSAVIAAVHRLCSGAPHARITPSASPTGQPGYTAISAQLHAAAEGLSEQAPRFEPRLRFPLLNMVVWLAEPEREHDLPSNEPDRLDKRVGEMLRQRGKTLNPRTDQRTFWANVRAYAEGPLPAWAAAGTILSAVWAAQARILLGVITVLLSILLWAAQVFLLSRAWAGRRRYRWLFRSQPYPRNGGEERAHTLRDFAVRVVRTRRAADGNPSSADEQAADKANSELEHLLVNAFLEDLRQGYQRDWRIWRRVAWARTSYPTLVVDGPGEALVQRIEEVRNETATCDPLLVIYIHNDEPQGTHTADDGAHPSPKQVPTAEAGNLWEEWKRALARDRELGSKRVLRVGLDAADAELFSNTPDPIQRRKPILADPFLPWVAALVLLIAPLTHLVTSTAGSCAPGISRVSTGECIGISDGDFAFHPRLKRALSQIHDANSRVTASRQPYVTIVYLGALSLPDGAVEGSDDLLADVHGELAGLALAQSELISNSGSGNGRLQLHILIANAGHGYRYASTVTSSILAKVNENEKVIGVVGFGESRSPVNQAIIDLGKRSIPMIGTAGTFDRLGIGSTGRVVPSYFPLSPPNSRLARHVVEWVRKGLPAQGVKSVRRPLVLFDGTNGDLYTKDLGEQYLRAFGGGMDGERYDSTTSLDSKVTDICSRPTPPDAIFYAGRAAQFGWFIDALSESRCHDVTVVAGDAVTQYVNDHAKEIGRNHRVRVLYTPLVSAAAWQGVPATNSTDFYARLDRMLADLDISRPGETRAPSHAFGALAYDAVRTLRGAAQTVYSPQPDQTGDLNRGGVLLALENLQPVDGSSGVVKLHGDVERHYAADRPVMLVSIDGAGAQHLVKQCGKLYNAQQTGC